MSFILFILLFFSRVFAGEVCLRPDAYVDVELGQLVLDKILIIENGRIKNILPGNTYKKKCDRLTNIILVPGMFESHAHIFFTQKKEDVDFENALVREAGVAKKIRIEKAEEHLKSYLRNGFTSVVDLGNSGEFFDVVLKNKIKNKGNFPRFFISGKGIATDKAQFKKDADQKVVNSEYLIINSKTNIDALLRNYSYKHIDILKLYLDNSPGEGGLSKDIVMTILKNKQISKFKKIAFHKLEDVGPKLELPEELQISFEHDIDMYYKNQLNGKYFFDPTLIDRETLKQFNYFSPFFYVRKIKKIKEFYKSNISLIIGSDLYFDLAQNNARGFIFKNVLDEYSKAGISNADILRGLTLNPAKSLRENFLGKISKNSFADLVGVRGNPLQDINSLKNVEFVMKNGFVVINNLN